LVVLCQVCISWVGGVGCGWGRGETLSIGQTVKRARAMTVDTNKAEQTKHLLVCVDVVVACLRMYICWFAWMW